MGWAILLNAQGFPALQPDFEIRIAKMAQPGCNVFRCRSCTIRDNPAFGAPASCLQGKATWLEDPATACRAWAGSSLAHHFGANMGNRPSKGSHLKRGTITVYRPNYAVNVTKTVRPDTSETAS
jgi:hypothetical protein